MSGCVPNAPAILSATWSSSERTLRSTPYTLSSSAKADDPVNADAADIARTFGDYWMPACAGMTAIANAPPPLLFVFRRGVAGIPFSVPEEWSAGRRQGFARPLTELARLRFRAPNGQACETCPRDARAHPAGLRGLPAGRCASRRSTSRPLPTLPRKRGRAREEWPRSCEAKSPTRASGPPPARRVMSAPSAVTKEV